MGGVKKRKDAEIDYRDYLCGLVVQGLKSRPFLLPKHIDESSDGDPFNSFRSIHSFVCSSFSASGTYHLLTTKT